MGAEPALGSIGRYKVVRRLEGQSREVYYARERDDVRQRPVVLAVFEMRAEDAKLLTEEVERCKQIDHPAITRVLELFEHQGKHVLVYESVPGMSLTGLMAHLEEEKEKLADRAACYLGEMIFGALAAAHHFADANKRSTPIVHGQLGPHQVFLSWEGDVKVLGFGLSRVFRLAQGIENEPEESRPFAAPEVRAACAPSVRSNVYTAAAMLWSLLAQRQPEPGAGRLPSLASLRPDLPRELSAAIDQATEPAVVMRGITSRELAHVFASVGSPEGKRELRWNVEVYRSIDSAEEGLPPPHSFPPAALSNAPPPPADSDDELLPLSSSDMLPASGAERLPLSSSDLLPVRADDEPEPVTSPSDAPPPSFDADEPTTQWRIPEQSRLRALLDAANRSAASHHEGQAGAEPKPTAPGPKKPAVTAPGGRMRGGKGRAPARTLLGIGKHVEEEIDAAEAVAIKGAAPKAVPITMPSLRQLGLGGPVDAKAEAALRSTAAVARKGADAPEPPPTQPSLRKGPRVDSDLPLVRAEQGKGGAAGMASRATLPSAYRAISAGGGAPKGAEPAPKPAAKATAAAKAGGEAAKPTAPGAVRASAEAAKPAATAEAKAGGERMKPGAAEAKAGGEAAKPTAAAVTAAAKEGGESPLPPLAAKTGGEAAKPAAAAKAGAEVAKPAPTATAKVGGAATKPAAAGKAQSEPPRPLAADKPDGDVSKPTAAPVAKTAAELPPTPQPKGKPAHADHDAALGGPAEGAEPPAGPTTVREGASLNLERELGAAVEAFAKAKVTDEPEPERAPTSVVAALLAEAVKAAASLPPPPAADELMGTEVVDLKPPPVPTSRRSLRAAAAGMPLKWVITVAVTAVASFAAGLILAIGPLKGMLGGSEHASSGAPSSPSARASAAPTPSAASSGAAGASSGQAASSAGAASSGSASANGDDGSSLPADLGYLVVDSSAAQAHVYISGTSVGPVGEKLRVRCGLNNVRLGSAPPNSGWISPGAAVRVACRSVTHATIEPGQSRPDRLGKPGPTGTAGRYTPNDL